MIVLWQESPPGRFYNTQGYSKSEQVRGGLESQHWADSVVGQRARPVGEHGSAGGGSG